MALKDLKVYLVPTYLVPDIGEIDLIPGVKNDCAFCHLSDAQVIDLASSSGKIISIEQLELELNDNGSLSLDEFMFRFIWTDRKAD